MARLTVRDEGGVIRLAQPVVEKTGLECCVLDKGRGIAVAGARAGVPVLAVAREFGIDQRLFLLCLAGRSRAIANQAKLICPERDEVFGGADVFLLHRVAIGHAAFGRA